MEKIIFEKESERHERILYECALAVEQDKALGVELDEWDVTIADRLEKHELR